MCEESAEKGGGGGWRVFVLEEKEEPMGHWGHRASWEAAAGQWGPSCGVWKEGAPGEGGSGWVTRSGRPVYGEVSPLAVNDVTCDPIPGAGA